MMDYILNNKFLTGYKIPKRWLKVWKDFSEFPTKIEKKELSYGILIFAPKFFILAL